MNKPIMVRMENITKTFPGVIANEAVTVDFYKGEIHALLGENGAGKSTLMNVLTGIYRPDEGEVYINQQKKHFKSPKDAIQAGIGMVHQHFRLIDKISVVENIVLGSDKVSFWNHFEKIGKDIRDLSSRYGLEVDPQAKVWQLSVGEQQRVEIIKMLYKGAEILILDEPTAVLTPQESADLFKILRKMAEAGKVVVIITHKMQEVMDAADRVTILRSGKAVKTLTTDDITQMELSRMMVGEQFTEIEKQEKKSVLGTKIIELKNVEAFNDKGIRGLKNIDLSICTHEILGIAGVAGNGQKELVEVMTGVRPINNGKILIAEEDYTGSLPRKFIEAGVSHVPEDRLHTGLVPNLNALDNMYLKKYILDKEKILDYKALRQEAKQKVTEYDIKISNLDDPVKLMSGGNLQKMLLAREIAADPKLILAVYPFRGLDIGAIESVRSLLYEEREKGKGILLISEDLDEIIKMSDRIIVLSEGEIMGEVLAGAANREEIGLMMAGISQDEKGV